MATYRKIGYLTGDNVRLRKTASTSGTVVTSTSKGDFVLTDGATTSGSGYTWYKLSVRNEGEWHTGYMVADYVKVLDENISLSSNGYSTGKTCTLSWDSVYEDYVTVSYTLKDNNGRTFSASGHSCTIDLSAYYESGQSVTFTLTASYSYSTGTSSVSFSKDDVSVTCTITYIGPTVSTPSAPTVAYDHDTKKFTVSWGACVGSYGSGAVTYMVFYGEWEDGYRAYSVEAGTSTSVVIDNWYGPYGKSTDYYFSVQAFYDGSSSSYSDYRIFTAYGPYLSWDDAIPTPTLSQIESQILISWPVATVMLDSGDVRYIVRCISTDVTAETTETSYLMDVPQYDVDLEFMVTALCDALDISAHSNRATIRAIKQTEPSVSTAVRCYLGGQWKPCAVNVYQSGSWRASAVSCRQENAWKSCG